VDLGDRAVEVLHPGRGHTAGDAVVRVPDSDVLFAGDLVEESALRGAVPASAPTATCWSGPRPRPGGQPARPGRWSCPAPPVDRDFVVASGCDRGGGGRSATGGRARPEMAAAAEWPPRRGARARVHPRLDVRRPGARLGAASAGSPTSRVWAARRRTPGTAQTGRGSSSQSGSPSAGRSRSPARAGSRGSASRRGAGPARDRGDTGRGWRRAAGGPRTPPRLGRLPPRPRRCAVVFSADPPRGVVLAQAVAAASRSRSPMRAPGHVHSNPVREKAAELAPSFAIGGPACCRRLPDTMICHTRPSPGR
jgi:hypothetical protein